MHGIGVELTVVVGTNRVCETDGFVGAELVTTVTVGVEGRVTSTIVPNEFLKRPPPKPPRDRRTVGLVRIRVCRRRSVNIKI